MPKIIQLKGDIINHALVSETLEAYGRWLGPVIIHNSSGDDPSLNDLYKTSKELGVRMEQQSEDLVEFLEVRGLPRDEQLLVLSFAMTFLIHRMLHDYVDDNTVLPEDEHIHSLLEEYFSKSHRSAKKGSRSN